MTKRKYCKPVIELKGFYLGDRIAASVPPPPGDLNAQLPGLDSNINDAITSYVADSAPTPTPSPSTQP